MPCIRIRPSNKRNCHGQLPQKRDFWGDADRGKLFLEQVEQKFGTVFSSRKVALSALHLQRRLFNMYITGERSIPDEVWARLRHLPNYKAAKPDIAPPLYVDDVDPLS